MNPARVRLAVIISLAALAACAGAARERVDSFTALGSSDTLVVGRIELVPPLRKDEQRIRGLGSGGYENKIFLIADERFRVLKGEPALADFSGRIEAILGKDFYVRSESKPFFILGGVLFLDIGGREMNKAYFPGGLKVSLRPGDKAVYVGTVRYHRNEFFEISKVAIHDDYERANAEFRKQFGTRYPLRKALLTPAK
jgi:hypothetical protein